jgi:hypothetical protein
MPCELRTIDLVPGAVEEAEKRLAAWLAAMDGAARLAGSFHTEIGPLNQLVQLWDDQDEDAGEVTPESLAVLAGLVVGVRRERLRPLPFSPPLPTIEVGPWFELRLYECATAEDRDRLAEAWRVALPERLARGPLAGVWESIDPSQRLWVHLWPYPSLDRRTELRREVRQAGVWPPALVARRLGLPAFRFARQENRVLRPAAFSPLR